MPLRSTRPRKSFALPASQALTVAVSTKLWTDACAWWKGGCTPNYGLTPIRAGGVSKLYLFFTFSLPKSKLATVKSGKNTTRGNLKVPKGTKRHQNMRISSSKLAGQPGQFSRKQPPTAGDAIIDVE